MPAATRIVTATARGTLLLSPAMMPAATTLLRLVTNGTDRSRLPTRITSVCPIAMKPSTLVKVRIARMLPVLKKLRSCRPVRIAPITIAAASTM